MSGLLRWRTRLGSLESTFYLWASSTSLTVLGGLSLKLLWNASGRLVALMFTFLLFLPAARQ